MKFAPMAIPAMALLQQHDAWRDILIEPAARRAAIEARGHSELGAFVRNWGQVKYVLIAYFLGNICAKNCCNPAVYVKTIASQRWDVF